MTVRWRSAAADVAVRAWDGQIVVYDRGSGDTHCLDTVASALYACLAEGGDRAEAELLGRLAHAYVAAAPADDALNGALSELEKLGLARRVAQ